MHAGTLACCTAAVHGPRLASRIRQNIALSPERDALEAGRERDLPNRSQAVGKRGSFGVGRGAIEVARCRGAPVCSRSAAV